jgi:hypothetical protein
MGAADHLQGKQHWYHGSKRHDLVPGVDQILPSNDERVGGSHYGYSHHDPWNSSFEADRGDYTFAADTEQEAEAWSPSGWGRPVTYVVDPGQDPEIEDEHHLTDYGEGVHAKVRGPMKIVDRIDIPRPDPEVDGQVVQGTFGGLNWGQYNKLPDNYTGPATMGVQYPETDNFKRISPAYERMQAENREVEEERGAKREQIGYRHAWTRAGQQSFFRDPYGIDGPEDWEKKR